MGTRLKKPRLHALPGLLSSIGALIGTTGEAKEGASVGNPVIALAAVLAIAILSSPIQAAGSPGDLESGLDVYPYAEALKKAEKEKKHTFIYFWTPACPWCKAFSDMVLTDQDVLASLAESFVVVSVNAEKERQLSRKYRLASVPYLVFLDSSGEVISAIPEPVAANYFLVYLEYVRTGAYSERGFREFVESLI
jgi:thioredoxin-related protein